MKILPSIAQLLKQGREYSETSIICEQSPSKLIHEVISETFCKICMCTEGNDIPFLRESLTFDFEQAEELNKLPIGTGIMKMMSDRWFHPFRVRIPYFPREKHVSDEEVRQRMEPILKNMRVKPRVDLLGILNLKVSDHGRIYVPESRKKGVTKFDHRINIWENYLLEILENPDSTKTHRLKKLGLTKWEFEKLESDLVKNNFIKLHTISFGRRGDSGSFAELLPKGAAYLGIPFEPLKGKGSYQHRLSQYILSKKLKNFSIEYRGADLAWFKANDIKVAVEIEMNPHERENILNNVTRDLENGFSEVWVVCRNESEREKIKYILDTWLDEEGREKIQIKLFRELT